MGGATKYCPITGFPLDICYEKENNNDLKYGHLSKTIVIFPDGSNSQPLYHNPDNYGNFEDKEGNIVHNYESSGIVISYIFYELLKNHKNYEIFMKKGINLYLALEEFYRLLLINRNFEFQPIKKQLNDNYLQYFGIHENNNKDLLKYYINPLLEEYQEEPFIGKNTYINGKFSLKYLNSIIDTFFGIFLQ